MGGTYAPTPTKLGATPQEILKGSGIYATSAGPAGGGSSLLSNNIPSFSYGPQFQQTLAAAGVPQGTNFQYSAPAPAAPAPAARTTSTRTTAASSATVTTSTPTS